MSEARAIASSDTTYLGARELASRIRAGELSSSEAMRAHLDRIDAVNPLLNAVVTPVADCEEQARAADAALASRETVGPLHGVPFTVKDGFDTAGIRTTRGSRLFADHVPGRDAAVIERLRTAGAILAGKTNVPEFLLWVETDNLVFGRTLNPWDRSRTAGGSSGGEAAAVAAGLSPLGVGSDLAGSVRLPAHYCGAVGLKPTHGLVPLTGHWPETLLAFMHVGFLARRVEDVAVALAASAGPDGEDWYAAPVPASTLAGAGGSLGSCRIALLTGRAFGPLEADVASALQAAAIALEGLGCDVEEAKLPALERHDWNLLTLVLFGAGGGAYLDEVIAGRHDELHPALRQRLAKRIDSLDDYLEAERAVDALRRDLATCFARYDVLLCPAAPLTAPPHGVQEVVIEGESFIPRTGLRAAAPFNLTGSPALTVPFAHDAAGLPIGVQLVGRRFDDAELLRAGAALEEARGPWAPPSVEP